MKSMATFKISKIKRMTLWIIFLVLIYIVLLIKILNFQNPELSTFLLFYSLAVSVYILSRFLIAHFYVPERLTSDSYEPTISFGVPAKNEENVIYQTISSIAKLDYPKTKMEIICVDDGSTDNTLDEMRRAQRKYSKSGLDIQVTSFARNMGKREGMAYCVNHSTNEIMIFIDSDSLVEKQAVRELVKFMDDPKVGAVTAHTYVANEDKNILTKMQSIRYFVAFKAYKGSESIFGTVTCCSGPCSAYRRKYLLEVLEAWLQQTFLSVRCTYGDDRSLTNALLQKGYRTLYSPTAKVYTFVPEGLRLYLKQQIRWKKSWTRECVRASFFMWRKNPIMSASFYMGFILPLLAPYIVFRAFLLYPVLNQRLPGYYLFGVVIMTLIMGVYYMVYTDDKYWVKAVLFSTLFSILFFWQLPYAIVTLRNNSWGTR